MSSFPKPITSCGAVLEWTAEGHDKIVRILELHEEILDRWEKLVKIEREVGQLLSEERNVNAQP